MNFKTPRSLLLMGLISAQALGCASASRTFQRLAGKDNAEPVIAEIEQDTTATKPQSKSDDDGYDRQAMLAELQAAEQQSTAPAAPNRAAPEPSFASMQQTRPAPEEAGFDEENPFAPRKPAATGNTALAESQSARDWYNELLGNPPEAAAASTSSSATPPSTVGIARTFESNESESLGFRRIPLTDDDIEQAKRDIAAVDEVPIASDIEGIDEGAKTVSFSKTVEPADAAGVAADAETAIEEEAVADEPSERVELSKPSHTIKVNPGPASPLANPELEYLLGRLKSRDPVTVKRAIHQLGLIGPGASDAIPELEKLMVHGEGSTSIHAALAIHRITPQNDRVLPALIEGLHNDQPTVRSFAASALCEVGQSNELTVPSLKRALSDSDPFVRLHVAEALAGFPIYREMATTALILCLEDENAQVRWLTTFAMASLRLDSREATEALAEALKDSDRRVRSGAAFALGEIGAPAAHARRDLQAAMDDTDADVQAASAHALRKIGETEL